MRLPNLFFAFLLCLFLPYSSQSAWNFNGSNNSISLAPNAAMSIPDADFTIAIRLALNSTTVGDDDVFYLVRGSGDPVFSVGIYGGASNVLFMFGRDNDGTEIYIESSPNIIVDTNFHVIIAQRSGNTFSLRLDGAELGTETNASFDAVTSAQTTLLGNYEFGTWANIRLGYVAFWPVLLAAGQEASLLAGFEPKCYPNSLNVYLPAIQEYIEIASGIAVMNSGTTVSAHPRIIYCN